jgi:hypothetical protein
MAIEAVPEPRIEKHEGILVVRDDLIEGGTRRVIRHFLTDADEFVYASPAYGYGQVALAGLQLCRRRQACHGVCRQAQPVAPADLRGPAGRGRIVDQGFYRNFVSGTIGAFEAAGAHLYNKATLVTAVGSLPIRIGKQFGRYRKLGKTHQNVLVFYNGQPKGIPEQSGECDLGGLAVRETAGAEFSVGRERP